MTLTGAVRKVPRIQYTAVAEITAIAEAATAIAVRRIGIMLAASSARRLQVAPRLRELAPQRPLAETRPLRVE
ncbi:hypothetical protein AAIH64_34030, partial [Pseudomonas aeruginosa]|uniref:hypothetical protein n=2 Tax=Pseudomonas aeruginosa TaxID=287 RepID=UPI0031B6B80A